MQHQYNRVVGNGVKLAIQLGVIGLTAALQTPFAWAGDFNSKTKLNIPSQDLASALTTLATQADLQILFSQDLVAGKVGAALSGEYSGSEALQRLLANADLDFTINGQDTIVIRARNTPMFRRTAQVLEQAPRDDEAAYGASTAAMGTTLEEIIVTAQKRAERLQDVPIAVTAISGNVLEEAGVNDTSSLTKLAPSLTFTQGNHPTNASFRVRGVGTAVFNAAVEPDVSVVVDGVVMSRAAQGFADLADIDRVEILRGPQGTLFGKNAVAGLINVTTKRPSRSFEGSGDATWAEGDEYRLRSSLSGPLFSDSLRARISGSYNHIGGNIDVLVPAGNSVRGIAPKSGEKMNGQESVGFRGKLDWDATDDLNFLLVMDYRNTDSQCCVNTFIQVTNPTLQQLIAPIQANFNNRQSVDNELTWAKSRNWIYSLEGNLKVGSYTLTSLTAYQAFDFDNNQPVDALNTPVPIFLPTAGASTQFDINGGPIYLKQFTQELRLTSPGNQTFNYVVGLYYLNSEADRVFRRRLANCATGTTGQPCTAVYRSQGDFVGFGGTQKTDHMAFFAQADLKLLGDLSALGGIRAQREKISYHGFRDTIPLVAGDQPLLPSTTFGASAGSGESTDSVITGKLGLKYEFTHDMQSYLTWSRGYKGAAYGVEFATNFNNGQNIPVNPETATSYELGFKGRMFDGRLVLNAAAFYSKFSNLQILASQTDPNTNVVSFLTKNAGSASTKGVEVEFTAKPFNSLTLSGGVTYLQTSVDIDGLQCPIQLQNSAVTIPVSVDPHPTNVCYRLVSTAPAGQTQQNVSGGQLPMASKWRGNLSVRYEQPVGNYVGFGQLTASSQSRFGFVIEQDPLLAHPGYTLVDLSLGMHDVDSRYQVSVFVKNLFDKHYLTAMSHAASMTTATVTPDNLMGIVPKDANRYFGVAASVSF